MGINNENKLTADLSQTKASNELKVGNTVDAMMHKPTCNKDQRAVLSLANWKLHFSSAGVMSFLVQMSSFIS